MEMITMSLTNPMKRKKVPSPRNLIFWPPVIPTGQYGTPGSNVFLLPNNAKLVYDAIFADNKNPRRVLAFNGGGYNVEGAASFGSFTVKEIHSTLLAFSPSSEKVNDIYFPVSLAAALGLNDGEVIGKWQLRLCQDNLKLPSGEESPTDEGFNRPIRSPLGAIRRLIYRLKDGGKLLFAYLILFSLPLVVVNWRAVLLMLTFSTLAGLLLIILWDVYPGKSILKGLLQAVLLIIILWLSRYALIAGFDVNILWIAFVVLTSSIWYSIIYSGIKWNS
jgi:hypothetical protein